MILKLQTKWLTKSFFITINNLSSTKFIHFELTASKNTSINIKSKQSVN